MIAWILSITGITVLSVLIDLILPTGQTAKYIKNVFAFIMIFVIISPLPKLINGSFNIDQIFESEDEIVLQEDFIYQVNRDKLTALEKAIESKLVEENINGVEVSISADIFSKEMEIKSIYVDLSDLVITPNSSHIDIKKAITKNIKNIVGEVDIIIGE